VFLSYLVLSCRPTPRCSRIVSCSWGSAVTIPTKDKPCNRFKGRGLPSWSVDFIGRDVTPGLLHCFEKSSWTMQSWKFRD
jgi:hypothetical protein